MGFWWLSNYLCMGWCFFQSRPCFFEHRSSSNKKRSVALLFWMVSCTQPGKRLTNWKITMLFRLGKSTISTGPWQQMFANFECLPGRVGLFHSAQPSPQYWSTLQVRQDLRTKRKWHHIINIPVMLINIQWICWWYVDDMLIIWFNGLVLLGKMKPV